MHMAALPDSDFPHQLQEIPLLQLMGRSQLLLGDAARAICIFLCCPRSLIFTNVRATKVDADLRRHHGGGDATLLLTLEIDISLSDYFDRKPQ
jgi:hypothetical protein